MRRSIFYPVMALVAALSFSYVSPALLHADTVYRWVDAEGKVHFSERPPKEQQAEEVDVRVSQGSGGFGGGPTNATEMTQQGAATGDGGQTVVADTNDPQYRAEMCDTARTRIEMLRNNNPRVRYPQPDGSYRRYTTEEIAQMISKDESIVAEYCN